MAFSGGGGGLLGGRQEGGSGGTPPPAPPGFCNGAILWEGDFARSFFFLILGLYNCILLINTSVWGLSLLNPGLRRNCREFVVTGPVSANRSSGPGGKHRALFDLIDSKTPEDHDLDRSSLLSLH